MPSLSVVRRHITYGSSFILDDGSYVALKSEIASHFGLYPNDVYIVGSSKLGFSIAEKKRYRYFHDGSDIDIAIVSSTLFDEMWKQVFDYWTRNGPLSDIDPGFRKYLFRGWIRPDLLPPADAFPLRGDWWDFFLSITSSGNYGPYELRGGLYKSLHFLEQYQRISVSKCQEALEIS
jgi:hypothetical protein